MVESLNRTKKCIWRNSADSLMDICHHRYILHHILLSHQAVSNFHVYHLMLLSSFLLVFLESTCLDLLLLFTNLLISTKLTPKRINGHTNVTPMNKHTYVTYVATIFCCNVFSDEDTYANVIVKLTNKLNTIYKTNIINYY